MIPNSHADKGAGPGKKMQNHFQYGLMHVILDNHLQAQHGVIEETHDQNQQKAALVGLATKAARSACSAPASLIIA